MTATILEAERFEIADDLWAIDDFFAEKNWSDGLPIVPPTEERVALMVEAAKRDGQENIGLVPPRWAAATVEKIAVNAVMAGCRPAHMPLLLAAVAAIADAKLNLYSLQATTGGPSVMLIVNGPIRHRLKLNSGANALGEGPQANATVGRAIRLIQRNIGGSYPGTTCKATLGWPGKQGMCVAENEEASPWEPLHVERGFDKEQSTVTAISADGYVRAGDLDSTKAEGVMTTMAQRINGPTGAEATVIFCPEHAAIIARGGYSKAAVKQFIWETTRYSMKDLPEEVFTQRAKRRTQYNLTRDSVLHVPDKPDDILLMVAGGDGSISGYIHGWGQGTPEGGTTRSVTKLIKD